MALLLSIVAMLILQSTAADYCCHATFSKMTADGRGSGLIATKDIKAKTLVMVSKAIASFGQKDQHAIETGYNLNEEMLTKLEKSGVVGDVRKVVGLPSLNLPLNQSPPCKGISQRSGLVEESEGGPKLRKWYGAPKPDLRDGKDSDPVENTSEESQISDEVRDAVLVTDADSMTGQLVLLTLILRRVRIRALVKDTKEMVQSFGSYVEPLVGDVADPKSLKKALRGVRAVLCSTKVGALADKEITKGIEHIVFLSQFAAYSNVGGLVGLLNSKARRQAEEDEAALRKLGIPCTIVRSATLRDEPGGLKGFKFKQGCTQGGSISREDAALICVKALEFPPKETLIFEVASGDDQVDDWGALFNSLNGSLG
ncbi:hypothetical protein L7F22_056133 [Adiantum nelumboides]|nr:hypothetical protein [Adiantum nelumboides]